MIDLCSGDSYQLKLFLRKNSIEIKSESVERSLEPVIKTMDQ